MARAPSQAPSEEPRTAFEPPAGPWQPAPVPGTVALALDLKPDSEVNLDAYDWWYRLRFRMPERWGGPARIAFDGLATLADVWLDGQHVAHSENMFVPLEVELSEAQTARAEHELLIRFAALAPVLEARRQRPRWRTALVRNQNLRWIRTTLLGRIPGWSPSLPPIGPWRAIRLVNCAEPGLLRVSLQAGFAGDPAARIGRISVSGHVTGPLPQAAWIEVRGFAPVQATLSPDGSLEGIVLCPEVERWWPHTHGTRVLYPVVVRLDYPTESRLLSAGRVGFRSVDIVDPSSPRFEINGVTIFCRGVCWTPLDLRDPNASPAALEALLRRLQAAGANMIRIGGTMVYESEAFYELCDELGILVWQDLMLANMDYPLQDSGFRAELEREVRSVLGRLCTHPSVVAYCGGSEIAQQAAMLGLPQEQWSDAFFDEALPALVDRHHPGTPVFPSSPCGGDLPFSPSQGVSHYYGVGAYLRPIEDVKWAGVRFTTECLGFSNIPEAQSLEHDFGGNEAPHHPRWKRGVPRDAGSGWDFEDVRDHYMQTAFRLDPVALRSQDMERYLEAARVVPAHVMERVFAEWRRPTNPCQGALVWFSRDLHPGAGWGIFDHSGTPKSVYWALARAWQPQTIRMTDDGLAGITCHIINDLNEPLEGLVEIEIFQRGRIRVARADRAVAVAPHSSTSISSAELLGRFFDVNYSYRFGPAQHDVVFVRLSRQGGAVLAEDLCIVGTLERPTLECDVLEAHAAYLDPETIHVTLQSAAWLQWVHLEAKNCEPDSNYFHLAPERERRITFRNAAPGERIRLCALNLAHSITLRPAPLE